MPRFAPKWPRACPKVEAYNGARGAVRRSASSEQRGVLDQVSAAVGKVRLLRLLTLL
ncbi:hypothetical protein ACF07M_33075 [Streptomyces globisporus]|uniref:hypothetical protein n=1 Tax=Streptomyces TaxID=1883 RepID=UPI001FADA4C7|nr:MULTISPECIES: hypothetical protein [unclassified Streptomyces]MDX2918260.1 hypothetical protein [Streptomyces sp. NE06-03C]MDX3608921.1 hypothetical protein [Streptomyces sp. FL06-04B]MDX3739644.1 hypothetical protein [Streptomyces sp. ID01-15D]